MAHEVITQVKRTIWVSKCDSCGDSIERTENPPRERFCNHCQKWVPFVEQSYTGPPLSK